MKAAAFILVFIAALYIAEHWHEPPQLAVTKAAMPYPNAPLTMPTMVCHAPSQKTGPCDFKDCSRRSSGELA